MLVFCSSAHNVWLASVLHQGGVCVFLNDDGVSLIMMELKKASVNLVLVLYVTI